MCLIAVFFRAVDDAPLVVGANREEHFDRPGTPPQLLDGTIRVVAGVDPRAGGTWLGVNELGVVVAVTNRRMAQAPPIPRSRGLLVRDLLANPSASLAVEQATVELLGGHYAGCNLLVADRDRAVVLHNAEYLRVWPLPPGLHVLTAADVNDVGDPRLSHAAWLLGQRQYYSSKDCIAALKMTCAQRDDGAGSICLRGEGRGTVSSSILAMRQSLAKSVYLHAQGSPDTTAYEDCSELLHEMAAGQGR
jgi:hypothetical protein